MAGGFSDGFSFGFTIVDMGSGTFNAVGAISRALDVDKAVTLSLAGTWVATVVLERSIDEGENFNIVETFTENHEAHVNGVGEVFRLRVTAYTSGEIVYFLGKPEK